MDKRLLIGAAVVVVVIIIIIIAVVMTRDKESTPPTTPPPAPSYTFYPGMDSGGTDGNIKNEYTLENNVPGLIAACNNTPGCVGFNTNGWLKGKIIPRSKWEKWTTDNNKGLYVLNGTPIAN